MSEERDVTAATEVSVEQPVTETKPKAAPVALRQGELAPQNAVELGAVLSQIATGGGFPERFDTKEKRMAAYNLAYSLMKSQWQLALNHIAIIKGQMSIYGELPGTLAERTGEVEEKHTKFYDENYIEICLANKNLSAKPFAAVTKIKRKGREVKEFSYTLDEAQKAGQYPPMKWDKQQRCQVPNPDSPWEKHFKTMLARKSQALAIKFEFPDALVGVPIAEYDFDEAPDIKDVTPQAEKQSLALQLNGKFSKQETVDVEQNQPH